MAAERVALRPEVKDEVLGRVLRRYLMQADEEYRYLEPRNGESSGALTLDGKVLIVDSLEEDIIREVLEDQRAEFERRTWR